MLEPRPPRRDPRVLALHLGRDQIEYAALDAWDVRGIGKLDGLGRALDDGGTGHLELRLRRLIVQTKPSAIVCAKPRSFWGVRATLKVIATVARASGLPLVSLAGTVLKDLLDEFPEGTAPTAEYPELLTFEASGGSAIPSDALKVALSAFTKIPFPPRRYAPTLPSHPSTDVHAGPDASAGSSSLRDESSARSRARSRPRRTHRRRSHRHRRRPHKRR